jgi:hypothetical protein
MPPSAPSTPLSQRLTPHHLAERVPWESLAFLSQAVGLLLLFVGGIVAVTLGVFPANCLTSTCHGGDFANVDYGVMVARLLLVLGLFGLATGAGLHLQFRAAPEAGASPEQTRIYLSRRRGEFLLLALTIILLVYLIVSSVTVYTAI